MGLGSWLSRLVERQLIAQFLRIELLVGLVGGLMPAALFTAYNLLPHGAGAPFRVLLYGCVLLVGLLVGLEIPLVMRILKRHFSERYALKELVSEVLTFDYLGALAVAVAFPLLFVPHLGLVRTGVFFGLLNAAVAVWALVLFRGELRRLAAHVVACIAVVAALTLAMVFAGRLTTWAEDQFYGDRIILRESSEYQRVVVTHGGAGGSDGGVRLFLNGNLQFHSLDEYRYHEALVHPALAAHGAPKRVLVLGGGDGLAVREVLRYASVQEVVLVELDPHITRLFATHPALTALNAGALSNPKVTIVNADAFTWLEQYARKRQSGLERVVGGVVGGTQGSVVGGTQGSVVGGTQGSVAGGTAGDGAPFDIVIADFPDPSNYALGKLYTTSFYQRADAVLAAGGWIVVQSTSPLIARKSFWTVVATLEAAGFTTTPYHVHVPSFGEWGFVLAGRRPWPGVRALPGEGQPGLRFLTVEGMPALLQFPPDMARVPAEPNRLSNQVLVGIFEEEWGKVR
jgi:spermidine synthase